MVNSKNEWPPSDEPDDEEKGIPEPEKKKRKRKKTGGELFGKEKAKSTSEKDKNAESLLGKEGEDEILRGEIERQRAQELQYKEDLKKALEAAEKGFTEGAGQGQDTEEYIEAAIERPQEPDESEIKKIKNFDELFELLKDNKSLIDYIQFSRDGIRELLEDPKRKNTEVEIKKALNSPDLFKNLSGTLREKVIDLLKGELNELLDASGMSVTDTEKEQMEAEGTGEAKEITKDDLIAADVQEAKVKNEVLREAAEKVKKMAEVLEESKKRRDELEKLLKTAEESKNIPEIMKLEDELAKIDKTIEETDNEMGEADELRQKAEIEARIANKGIEVKELELKLQQATTEKEKKVIEELIENLKRKKNIEALKGIGRVALKPLQKTAGAIGWTAGAIGKTASVIEMFTGLFSTSWKALKEQTRIIWKLGWGEKVPSFGESFMKVWKENKEKKS